ncbi:unnamed protein product, partial [Linum tenue]
MSDFWFDQINKSSLMADGHFKKFIFRTTLADLVIGEAEIDLKDNDDDAYLVELCDQHLSSIYYLAEMVHTHILRLPCHGNCNQHQG